MPLTHEDLLDLVRLRMEPLKKGDKMLTFQELQKAKPVFGALSEVKLGEEFVRAFKENLVEVKVKSIKAPERLPRLEADLRGAFERSGLATAIVVEKRDEESLPARLGLAAAHHLADDRLRNDEYIGVAAGQTIGWLSRYVRDAGRIRAQGITFVSLTGLFCARQRGTGPDENLLTDSASWKDSEGSNILIDADINAIRMAQGVRNHVDFVLVASPAVGSLAQTRAQVSRNTWFGARNGSRPTLDRALVGIGALHDNWRFFDAVNARNPKHPVRMDLDRLKAICKAGAKTSSRGYLWWPVFDVANHLILTEPRDGCALKASEAKVARELVRRLNERVVTVGKRDLKATKLWAIAGGERKCYGIFDALDAFEIETLVTDDATAIALLGIHGARKN